MKQHDIWDAHQNNTAGEGQRLNDIGHKLIMTESGADSWGAEYIICPPFVYLNFYKRVGVFIHQFHVLLSPAEKVRLMFFLCCVIRESTLPMYSGCSRHVR